VTVVTLNPSDHPFPAGTPAVDEDPAVPFIAGTYALSAEPQNGVALHEDNDLEDSLGDSEVDENRV
jgi:hypothetical protein